MFLKTKIHFEISERKVILRFFDFGFVLTALYLAGCFFDFNYFIVSKFNPRWIIVLGLYISFFATIFEMYNLQVASNQFQIIRSTILTASTTVLVYLLTPIFTPQLPTNRIQMLVFYLTVFSSLFLWRMIYVHFLASKRFAQNAILICDKGQLEELILGLESIDPHYKIVAYISSDCNEKEDNAYHYVRNIKKNDLVSFVKENSISEIVIASQKTEGITIDLYHQLISLLESGNSIREYTQVYESKTQRIPVQYISRDFYRFFPFSRSNNNKLYILCLRIF